MGCHLGERICDDAFNVVSVCNSTHNFTVLQLPTSLLKLDLMLVQRMTAELCAEEITTTSSTPCVEPLKLHFAHIHMIT